jgi:hypothetical protein
MINFFENKLEENCDEELVTSYLKKVRKEFEETCSDGIIMVKEKVLPAALTQDIVVFCHNL